MTPGQLFSARVRDAGAAFAWINGPVQAQWGRFIVPPAANDA